MKNRIKNDIILIVEKGMFMASLQRNVETMNIDTRKSNPKAIFKGVNYRITILSERLIRLEYDITGEFNDDLTLLVKNRNFNLPNFKVNQDEKYLVITTKYFIMQYSKEKPFKGPNFAPDSNLKVKLINTDKIWYLGHPEARNYKGSAFSIETDNDKVKLDNGLYSTDGFATLDDSFNPLVSEDGFIKRNSNNKIDLYLFMYRRDFGLCLKDYFSLTGFPPLIPRYSLGIWWNRDMIYSYEDTKNLIKSFNKHEIPISVLLLNEFWHKKDKDDYNKHKTGFTFNKELFKNPQDFTKYMHDHGVRVGVNIDPVEGISTYENNYPIMAHELGIEKGETIKLNVYDPNFIKSYFKNLISPLYDEGVDFFWLDYSKNKEELAILDYYHYQDFNRFKEKRPLLLTRNAGIAAHNYPICYSGETKVSWDTLKYLPFFDLTSANIGLSWWSHDVGGFKDGIENSELYIRYVEALTFSPIFRFSAKRGAFYKREPWKWDMLTYTIVKDYCNLRQKLIPYLYTLAAIYHETGIPIIQPLYYLAPEIYDEPLYKDEYFFGTELLVKPITKKKDNIMNRSVERIFLPKGIWYDFRTGKKFIGGKRYVTFYNTEDYPVFAKAGSIIPLAILNENLNDTSSPRDLEFHIFPGKSNTYELYEDDGVTTLYKEGYYLKTNIEFKYMANDYTVIISPKEGKTGIVPEKRNYQIRFKNTRMPEKIEIAINNIPIDHFETKLIDNDLIVYIEDISPSSTLTLNCRGKDIEIDAVRILNEDINSIINDLDIETILKEKIADIIFSNLDVKKKRIEIRKLKKKGLNELFIKMFLKLLEYINEI